MAISKRDSMWIIPMILILLGILMVFSEELSMNPPFLREIERIRKEMKLTALAAEDYRKIRGGRYPDRLDDGFRNLIVAKAKEHHIALPLQMDWLSMVVVKSKEEALARAHEDLDKRKVLYCAVKSDEHSTGFYVLGKDSNGTLLNGLINGEAQRPLVIAPGQSANTK